MNERESKKRLAKLIDEADNQCAKTKQCEDCKGFGMGENCVNYVIADHLLANGVIVPPCKVGDTVYVIATKRPCYACKACSDFCHRDCRFDDKTKLVVKKATVDAICSLVGTNEIHVEIEETITLHSYSATYYFNDLGKTVFLTREEAEKALAERSKV